MKKDPCKRLILIFAVCATSFVLLSRTDWGNDVLVAATVAMEAAIFISAMHGHQSQHNENDDADRR